MPKAPRSVVKRARHKKWLKRAKGFRGRRRTVFKIAKEAILKAGQHAYRDRRKKKAVFRAGWHIAINAAVRPYGLSYSRFINALREKKVGINRKMLAQMAKEQPDLFGKIVDHVKK
ncbi:MAG: 50S ribosomal protein L20 [Candidatus Andersenbacteria bacterium]|nr:50S ribosomal protein L20 [Candidatus Andersenbacteria bacterium]MBI3250968.1 50S ribosomal protein L20 [Candidatus Andersenbacteria bacterium]